ncbi:thiolase [Acrocarpospora pleiomorpha]|uniref:Thiolase n=1 Tax=Acrocarpospora pleiomorpha TaxID=90975 RepID=A0A5M3XJW8_9ACTN|nr:thiolase family protein [Acrocarpospora pleiomorpha]GES21554.1 thiolase [Acrocarpospora pleiomorpha]
MIKTLQDLRPVYVVGIGLHRYQRIGDTSFVQLGLTAVRAALDDARLTWPDIDHVYTGTATSGMAVSRPILKHLGVTGIPMTQIENASASGSSAVRLAAITVASGLSDASLALGVDKGFQLLNSASRTGVSGLADHRIPPPAHFALLASEYIDTYGATPAQLAAVAVKNHRNGALNPYAQRQKVRTLEEVMADAPIAGVLTRLQCCPIGEGAAAAILVSEDAIERCGLDRSRCVRVASSAQFSEELYGARSFDAELTRRTTRQAMAEADIRPEDLDLVELHDAFTIEELQYVEAMGLCAEGDAAAEIAAGAFDIGGRTAVSASGGLIAMGHPTGPTGVGQVVEITRQLRGEAGARQQPEARWGLAHMVGLGAVCVAHVLEAPEGRH